MKRKFRAPKTYGQQRRKRNLQRKRIRQAHRKPRR